MTISGRFLRFSLSAMAILCFGAYANPHSAHSESLYRTDGNASKVSVWGAGDEATAEPFAERHCESFGKAAHYLKIRPNRVSRFTYINSFEFECASPGASVRQ